MIQVCDYVDSLSLPKKLDYFRRHPDFVKLIDGDDVLYEYNNGTERDLFVLDSIANIVVEKNGDYIFDLIDSNFKIYDKLITKAFKSNPLICTNENCPPEWFTRKNVHIILQDDIKNVRYIPEYWLDRKSDESKKMIKYFQKIVREGIRENENLYDALNVDDINERDEIAFTCLNALTYRKSQNINILKTYSKLWDSNGGKILFKIARKAPDIALKMINEESRLTFIGSLVSKYPETYAKLPEMYANNPKIKFKAFKSLINSEKSQLVDELYNPEEIEKMTKRLNGIIKKQQHIVDGEKAVRKTASKKETINKIKFRVGHQFTIFDWIDEDINDYVK